MFTKEQINEIACKLGAMSKRDSQMPFALPLNGTEQVVVLQDMENRIVSIREMCYDFMRHLMTCEFRAELWKAYGYSNVVMNWTLANAITAYIDYIDTLSRLAVYMHDALDVIEYDFGSLSSLEDKCKSLKESVSGLKKSADAFAEWYNRN